MVSVVLAGGGTAGHTSPLIATAQALLQLDENIQITCIGTARGLETRLVPQAGLELKLVPAVPLPRKPSLDLAKLPFRLTNAVLKARKILRKARADVVVGFGGYASAPAYLAAKTLGIPVVVQEQNVLPGMANKLAAKFAAAVLTSFPETKLGHAKFLGMPLRQAITELANSGRTKDQAAQRAAFGLVADLPVLLVSGGSQGARSLNEATTAATTELLAAGIQILHVWGPKNFHDGLAEIIDEETGAHYVPLRYVDEMTTAYAAADLMLARSGAGTVAETASIGLPTILVPLAIGNGEQARNAAGVVQAGAALLVPDAELDADWLVKEVKQLMTDPDRLAKMAAAGPKLMKPGASQRVAEVIYQLAQPEVKER